MKLSIIEARDEKLIQVLKTSLSWAHTALLAVSYANLNAFEIIRAEIESFLRRNSKLRTIFDIERLFTEKRVIEELATIPGDSECKVMASGWQQGDGLKGPFHSKFYLFYDNDKYCAIIGSSNFTLGGLKNNIECNFCLSSERDDLFVELSGYFWKLWESKGAINILAHQEILDDYKRITDEAKKHNAQVAKHIKQLNEDLNTKASEIIKAKDTQINAEFAYFLGLISANSIIDYEKGIILINLQRGKVSGGLYYYPDVSSYKISQDEAHRKDTELIQEKLKGILMIIDPSCAISSRQLKGYHFEISIHAMPDSRIFQYLKAHGVKVDKHNRTIPFVPKDLERLRRRNITMAFLRGYCDLKSRISLSDGIYSTIGGKKKISILRMGVSLSHRHPELLPKFRRLFKQVRLERSVSYSDPTKRNREFLMRIDVRSLPVDLVGTHWRKIFLKDFKNYMASPKQKEKRKIQ